MYTQELESHLQRPHLVSVKPQIHLPPPPTSTTHSHPQSRISSLPRPLPFPPNRRKSIRTPSPSSQVVVKSDSGDCDVQVGMEGGVCEEEEVVVVDEKEEEEEEMVESDPGDEGEKVVSGDDVRSDNHIVEPTNVQRCYLVYTCTCTLSNVEYCQWVSMHGG